MRIDRLNKTILDARKIKKTSAVGDFKAAENGTS